MLLVKLVGCYGFLRKLIVGMFIPVNRIIVNKQAISEEHVDDFVELLERGRKVKPITVRKAKPTDNIYIGENLDVFFGGELWVLVDGRHRLAAHKVLGKEMIEVMVTL